MKSLLGLLFFLIPLAWSTRVNANYVTAKTFLIYFLSSVSILFLPTTFKLRKWGKSLTTVVFIILAYQLLWVLKDFDYYGFLYSFKFITLLFFALYFYSLELDLEEVFEKTTWVIAMSVVFVLGITLWQMYNTYEQHGTVVTGLILSTFGNVNMATEFMIISLPFIFLWTRYKDPVPRNFKLACFSLIVFLILFLSSRSAWIGLFLWLLFAVYRRMDKKEWLAVGAGFLLFAISQYAFINTVTILHVKSDSSAERLMLYEGSLKLILDHPLGIQTGRFLSEIMPYVAQIKSNLYEYTYFDQPHSEILKWLIQFGWPMFFVMFGAFGVLSAYFFSQLKKTDRQLKINPDFFCFESFLVLLPQILFQFPFENPATIFYIAFVMGYFFSNFEETRAYNLPKVWFRSALVVLALIGIVNSFFFITAVYRESTESKNLTAMKDVCAYYPLYYKACFWKNLDDLEQNKGAGFKADFVKDMSTLPFYTDYLRLTPRYYGMLAGNDKRMCESLLIYEAIYRSQKTYPNDLMAHCHLSYKAPFELLDTRHFKDNYLNWLEN